VTTAPPRKRSEALKAFTHSASCPSAGKYTSAARAPKSVTGRTSHSLPSMKHMKI
jgi:hypothetical protein